MEEKIRIYCDTNIYLDFLLGRKDHIRPLDEFARQIFKRVEDGEFLLIISDHLLFELQNKISNEELDNLLQPLHVRDRLIKIEKTQEEIEQAKNLSKEHWKDMLHAVLAKRAKAKYIITRNVYDFAGSEHLVQTMLPENI